MGILHNLEEQKSIHFQSCVVLKKKKSPFVHRMINLKILTGFLCFLSWRELSVLLLMGQCLFTLHFNEVETLVFVDRYKKVAVAAL